MGCWNGTCGISNLPIRHGENIVLFVIEHNEHAEHESGGFCYPWDQYEPITVPLFGEYNDYGGIENVTKNGDIVFKHLTSRKFDVDDKEADRQGVTNKQPADIEELINDYIERGVYKGVGFMMVRQDIYDGLMNEVSSKRDQYEKGAQSFIDSYQAQKKQAMEDLKEELKELSAVDASKEMIERAKLRAFRPFDFHQFDKKHDNKFIRAVSSYHGGWHEMRDLVWALAETQDKDLQEALIDLIMMDYVLFPLRKAWCIQPGAGSQSDETDLHVTLALQIIKSANQIKHHYSMDELMDDEKDVVNKKIQEMNELANKVIQTGNEIGSLIEQIIDEALAKEQ